MMGVSYFGRKLRQCEHAFRCAPLAVGGSKDGKDETFRDTLEKEKRHDRHDLHNLSERLVKIVLVALILDCAISACFFLSPTSLSICLGQFQDEILEDSEI